MMMRNHTHVPVFILSPLLTICELGESARFGEGEGKSGIGVGREVG